jgi:hypothetical protein
MFFRYASNTTPVFTAMPGVPLIANNLNGERTLSWMANVQSVPAGETNLAFEIAYTNPGGGTTTINSGRCAIEVVLLNDNPITAPFDE